MQKRNRAVEASNTNHVSRKSNSGHLPELISIDVLGIMQDDDLVSRLRAMDEDRMRAIESGRDPRPWEEEIAYVRREQQIRVTRREIHAKFNRRAQLEYEYEMRLDATLAQGDFDNLAFVYAAVGGRPRYN